MRMSLVWATGVKNLLVWLNAQMEQDRVVLLIRALVLQVALYAPRELGQHTTVQGQAELRHGPRP